MRPRARTIPFSRRYCAAAGQKHCSMRIDSMEGRSSVVAARGLGVAVYLACALAIAVTLVCFCCAQRAEAQTLAQLTLPGTTATTAPSSIRQSGIYLTAPVTLDGNMLFTIASSTLASPSQLSLQQRLADIQTRPRRARGDERRRANAADGLRPAFAARAHRASRRSRVVASGRCETLGSAADRYGHVDGCTLQWGERCRPRRTMAGRLAERADAFVTTAAAGRATP